MAVFPRDLREGAAQTLVVSGGNRAAAKTTLLNVLSRLHHPKGSAIVTIEGRGGSCSSPQGHWVQLESRPPNIEGKGRR